MPVSSRAKPIVLREFMYPVEMRWNPLTASRPMLTNAPSTASCTRSSPSVTEARGDLPVFFMNCFLYKFCFFSFAFCFFLRSLPAFFFGAFSSASVFSGSVTVSSASACTSSAFVSSTGSTSVSSASVFSSSATSSAFSSSGSASAVSSASAFSSSGKSSTSAVFSSRTTPISSGSTKVASPGIRPCSLRYFA